MNIIYHFPKTEAQFHINSKIQPKTHNYVLGVALFSSFKCEIFIAYQNREVYAIPGNLSSETSKGTNHLITENLSKLALSPEYVVKDLGIENTMNISINDLPEIKFQTDSEKYYMKH